MKIDHAGQEMSDFPDMHVRIVETGDKSSTLEIDSARRGAGQVPDIVEGADGRNSSPRYRQRARHGRSGFLRQQGAVEEDGVDPLHL
jgi:hypothetical protein